LFGQWTDAANSYLIHVELEELHEKVISKGSLKDVLIYNVISYYWQSLQRN